MTRARADIDALGTHRRIRGMMAQGYSGHLIAKAAGIRSSQRIFEIMASGSVRPQTAAVIKRAAKRVGVTQGPSTRSARRAERDGWPPLWAWLPGTIDIPAAEPWMDEVAIERVIRAARLGLPPVSGLSRAEQVVAVGRLASAPYWLHDSAISRGMHRSQSWVRCARMDAGVAQVVAAPGRRAA